MSPAIASKGNSNNRSALVTPYTWQGVPRYFGTFKLGDFPLILVAGLSQTKQLATVEAQSTRYTYRAYLVIAARLGGD